VKNRRVGTIFLPNSKTLRGIAGCGGRGVFAGDRYRVELVKVITAGRVIVLIEVGGDCAGRCWRSIPMVGDKAAEHGAPAVLAGRKWGAGSIVVKTLLFLNYAR
jgi:hypothetical protein